MGQNNISEDAGKVRLSERSKVKIQWKVKPIDYSHDEEENIRVKFARKYGIPKENVKVEPYYVQLASNMHSGEVSDESIHNVQDPSFQRSMFRQYAEERGVTDCDFDLIDSIDEQINAGMNYELYDAGKKYSIKWLKWSNFMSYGPDNYIDLTQLHGIVHLASMPANQGGKTTFCLDLLRFLLFGKVTSREDDWTLSKVFNRYIPEATDVVVEGCVCIDGQDYVINRTVSRPALKKRTDKSKVTQKVTYYHLVNGERVEMEDTENAACATNAETTKKIKESLGNERDFDLMICVSSDNLKQLISLKDTERGRLISRWIGLLPLEEKDRLARDTYNKSVLPKLALNRYNKETLRDEIESLRKDRADNTENIAKWKEGKADAERKLADFRKNRDTLLQSKQSVDESLMKVDVATMEATRDRIVEEGKRKKAERTRNEEELKNIGEIHFNENHYNDLLDRDKHLAVENSEIRNDCRRIQNEIDALKKGEFCPTCGARLKGVDNSGKISEKETALAECIERGKSNRREIDSITAEIEGLKAVREKWNRKNSLDLLIAKNNVDIENLTSRYKDAARTLKDIEVNKAAIENNNRIETALNVVNVNITTEETNIRRYDSCVNEAEYSIRAIDRRIEENSMHIEQIVKEEKLVRNWKIYLDMIGKNGISKMLVRNVLPIINGRLESLLCDVCDFNVEVVIDDHNDVAFHLIHDGVVSNLASGSGFEQTVASLALRSVLSQISSFSKPSFVVFDEILGGVADENYDQVKLLYDKIIKDYSLIFQISHLKQISDWASQSLIVKKNNNISTIEIE